MAHFQDVTILSSWSLQEPHEDDLLLTNALREEHLRANVIPWEDFKADNQDTSSVLFRSTWGYYKEAPAFRKFLKTLDRKDLIVWNPISLIRWNLNKKYLIELRRKGCPVVPTKIIDAEKGMDVDYICKTFETESIVVKPAIGASGSNTFRISLGDRYEDIENELRQLQGQKLIVQPFMESVVSEGEYSLVFIDGSLTHCVLKKPAEDDFRVQSEHGGQAFKVQTPPAALRTAKQVLENLPEESLYARIDLVRGANNRFLLLEAELIEPQLYFSIEPKAALLLASAVSKRL